LAVKPFPEDKIDLPTSSNRTPYYEVKKRHVKYIVDFLRQLFITQPLAMAA